MTQNVKFDDYLAEQLKDPEFASMYLEEFLAEGNDEEFLSALRTVAEVQKGGMTNLAKDIEHNRQSLYTALSEKGNPRFSTLNKVLSSLGMRITITPTETHVQ